MYGGVQPLELALCGQLGCELRDDYCPGGEQPVVERGGHGRVAHEDVVVELPVQ